MKVEERGRNKSRLGLRNWRKEAGTEVFNSFLNKPKFTKIAFQFL